MKHGLTLVELIITITLAAILGTAAGLLFSEHITGAMRARDSTVGMNLARGEMERLDSLNNFFATPDLNVLCPSGAEVVTGPTAFSGYPYSYTRRVRCLEGDCCAAGTNSQGVKRVQVTVTKTGSGETVATLVTYRTKHVAFGS